MHKRNETATLDPMQLFTDILVIFLGYIAANFIYWIIMNKRLFFEHIWIFILFSVVFSLSMQLMLMYNVTTFHYVDRIIKRTISSTLTAYATLNIVVFMAKISSASRLLFLLFCMTACMFVLSYRFIIRFCKIKRIGNNYTHVLFVGDNNTLENYTRFIDKTAMKLKIERFVSYNDEVLGDPETFSQLLMEQPIDEVQFVFALDGENNIHNLRGLFEMCETMGITTRIIIDSFECSVSKYFLSSVGTYPVITYHSVSFAKTQLLIKRFVDIMFSTAGLLMLLPLFAVTAVAIKLDSPGPVFFKQKRVGINGKVFRMYKFRSMFIDAEAQKNELMAMNKIKDGMMFKIDNDPRITKVGSFIRKTSIDELPQLLNVLKCEMSLVGTRPPTLDEVRKYHPEHWKRITIKPGITGMWQVNGRSQILDFNDVIQLDKEYIDRWSLRLDFMLMLKTVAVVFTKRGAV